MRSVCQVKCQDLTPIFHMMILFALRISKVSYVAAAREVNIVFSVLFGIMLLKEKNTPQKLVGAVLITLGVIFIGQG